MYKMWLIVALFNTLLLLLEGVLLYIDNLRWEDVPFLLVSGKDLDERTSYVRVVFKDNAFCLQKESSRDPAKNPCKPSQIIFHIGHGELGFPAVLVSRNLFRPNLTPSQWQEVSELPPVSLFGQPSSDYYIYRPIQEKDAYTILISNIFRGKKESFVTTENLLAAWQFWTPLLESLERESPRIYPGGSETSHLLDFTTEHGELHYRTDEKLNILGMEQKANFASTQSTFLRNTMVSSWAEQLVQKLSQDMQKAADEAVKRSGTFHLALSGGSSPIALLQTLSKHHHGFPWKRTHLWMVDERCVPLADIESNFGSIERHLLQHVRIPYANIHPMPVHINQRLCAEEDLGTQAYTQEISALVGNSSFDFVLLGLGHDGHTASIFPGSTNGITGDELVVLSKSPQKPYDRMSLSLPLINKAQKVAILVLGKGKHDIVTLISRAESNINKWPIFGVNPLSGQLVWYIDYETLFM